MAAMDWLQFASHQSHIQVPREHYHLLDNYLFMCIYIELYQFFCHHEDHPVIFINHLCGVEDMSERNLIGEIIKDILHSEAYTIEGIAYYTHTEVDIIYEIMIGLNPNPSISLSKKIMSLHKEVRPNLYRKIIKECLEKHVEEVDS